MPKQKNINTLQLIRGFAALFVVLFHATGMFKVLNDTNYLAGAFSSGYLGVDIFFVLSGFIIYYIHSNDQTGIIPAKNFYTKRFLRVYPIYWIVLLLLLPVYYIIPSFGEEAYKNPALIIKSFLLIPQELNILNVSWTLSHEILFYIIFGFVLYNRKTWVKLLFGAWIIVSMFLLVFKPESGIINFVFSPLNIEFAMGILIAYIIGVYKGKFDKSSILLGSILLLLTMVNDTVGLVDLHRVIAFGIPSAFIIYGAVALEQKHNIIIPKSLKYLGDASYSIYLTHYALLSAVNKVFVGLNLFNLLGNTLAITFIVLITVLSGCIFHSLIEKPLLKLLRKKMVVSTKKQDSDTLVQSA